MRGIFRQGIVLALLAAAALLAPAAAAAGGLTLTGQQQLDARLTELTFTTPAIDGPTHVRVLVPAGYDPRGARRYPVLYLLHGAWDDYRSWTDKGDAENITAGQPVIVVMPDGGQSGFYSDWYHDGAGGPPEWETFHIRQLVPWIDAHYRTIAARSGRAVAGLSMGGFGAMSYAARHPDLFVAAASFSGALNTNNPEPAGQPDLSVFSGEPNGAWGPRATEEVRWRAHNPWDLADNLRGLSLTIRTGNGSPGGPYGGGDPIEYQVHAESVDMHNQLERLGIEHVFEDYGPGGHAWEYWQRDLTLTLPDLMATFAHPPARPRSISFAAVEPTYSVYGWRVAIQRPALEWSRLTGASRAGFSLTGSGYATVRTPPAYRRGTRYRILVRSHDGLVRIARHAGRDRRLTVRLQMGPGNHDQEYRDGAVTNSYTTTVGITRAGR